MRNIVLFVKCALFFSSPFLFTGVIWKPTKEYWIYYTYLISSHFLFLLWHNLVLHQFLRLRLRQSPPPCTLADHLIPKLLMNGLKYINKALEFQHIPISIMIKDFYSTITIENHIYFYSFASGLFTSLMCIWNSLSCLY